MFKQFLYTAKMIDIYMYESHTGMLRREYKVNKNNNEKTLKKILSKKHFSRADIWVHGVVSILDLTRIPCWLESWQSYTLLARSTR